ncbi:T9SS type A sorting domain-containing protein [Hymenobacter chitinivorans]|uniref:Putative secreted protein (Por secretion system target) n=1 Tax=Hymenobacter chitinivorans DSM 11115 TaxID=1121954 RepID=A0A2M9BLU3_9BACT|nr:T9SS type A sorting domain-containing protein [Hymenobacter chitinivorans]PJJ58924.1 putative secreted protein (Por secretion system target) [Hymenobacter chitinivorans DSM 11115]
MKKLYSLLLIGIGLGQQAAQAQQWRPFRPNQDVHAFRGASADTVFTMRLDSAGVQGADSVYYFNRTLRRANPFDVYPWQKSRNNKLGQQLRYNPAARTYALYWDGGPTMGNTMDRMLVLKPFAKVGDTWSSYFTDYGVSTTLVSRGTQVLDGVTDSVATFRCSSGTTVVLSKNNGVVSASQDLLFGVPNAKVLTLARRPAPAGRSYYNPLSLLDLQPGNELGYYREPLIYSTFACYTGQSLRRVLTRQLTADSLIYTFQQQSSVTYSSAPNCGGTGFPTVSPVQVVRLAASLRTGRWAGGSRPNGALIPAGADLLAYEYRVMPGASNTVLLGYPVVTTPTGSGTCSAPALLRQQELYRNRSGNGTYAEFPAIDLAGWKQELSPGVGILRQSEQQLTYSRRTANGADQICGSRTSFGTLLPTKAAQAAALMALFPNPAAELVTLRLAQAPAAATTVRLLDKLGRCVLVRDLQAGQLELNLPLHEVAAGLYIVEVQRGTEGVQHLKLQHSR